MGFQPSLIESCKTDKGEGAISPALKAITPTTMPSIEQESFPIEIMVIAKLSPISCIIAATAKKINLWGMAQRNPPQVLVLLNLKHVLLASEDTVELFDLTEFVSTSSSSLLIVICIVFY